MARFSRMILVACMPLLGGLVAGCRPADDDRATSASAEQNEVRLDGDAVFRQLVVELGSDPAASVRSALDRAVNQVAGLSVLPYPGSCTGRPERLVWNGEQQPYARFGVVGVADLLVLDAHTQGPIDTSRLAEAAVPSDADLARALAVLAEAESPALMADAIAALSRNPEVKGAPLRALVAFGLELEETKRFRDAGGKLRVPDLTNAPSDAVLFERLRTSPILSMRESAARFSASGKMVVTPAQADLLLADPSYRVRAAAGAAFWKSSDTSPAHQAAVLATFATDAAKKQMRADVLRERYGVREEDAGNWSDLPAGIEAVYLEAIGGFVGDALEHAPASADVGVLVEATSQLRDLGDIVETSVEAVERSTSMTRAAKITALGRLRKAAAAAAWDSRTTPLLRLAKATGTLLLEAPLAQLTSTELVAQLDESYTFALGDATWATVRAGLDSPDANVRLASLEQMALSPKATEAGAFQALLLARTDLDPARRTALLDAVEKNVWGQTVHEAFAAARASGTDPHDVLARTKRMFGAPGPYGFRPPTASAARAYADAAADPALSGAEVVDAVVYFTSNVEPIAVTGTGPNEPGVETHAGVVRSLLGLLEDPRVGAAARDQAVATILDGPQGLRGHLLVHMPKAEAFRKRIAAVVRPHLVQPVATCWAGQMENSKPRPAIVYALIPYVTTMPTIALDPAAMRAARAKTVRDASAGEAVLPAGTTPGTLFAALPKSKDQYLGLDMWAGPARAAYERPAAQIAADIVTPKTGATPEGLALLVRQLGYAHDFRALPPSALADVEAAISAKLAPAAAAAQYLFFLRAMNGDGYDALAARFRTTLDFRWDLADAARPKGEPAALETLLASVGTDFATLGSTLALASQVVAGANVSEPFRQGLLEWDGETERFWGTRGQWATGLLPITRSAGPSLGWVVRGDPMRRLQGMSPSGDEQSRNESSLYGTITRDPRLPAAAAVALAWERLALGKVAETTNEAGDRKLYVTVLVDTVLGTLARPDVAPAEKDALGKALRYVLE